MRTFVVAAELSNFSAAGKSLNYSQSTVTQQIQSLERELGVRLFERSKQKVGLSKSGHELLRYAYQILKYESELRKHFSYDTEPAGEIRIGTMDTIIHSLYAQAILEYMHLYPKVSIDLDISTSYGVMDTLSKGDADLIITLDRKLRRSEWKTSIEIPVEISFFCAHDHPFADCQAVTLEQLIQERMIMVEEGCNYRLAFEENLLSKGYQLPPRVLEVGNTNLIIDAVSSGLGISLLPRYTLDAGLQTGSIRLVHVKEYRLFLFIQVIYNENRWVTPAVKSFLRFLKKYTLDKEPKF